MAQLRNLTILALVLVFASAANGETLIVDSFESGDMSTTNEDGFAWGMNNRTSVVTEEAAVYNNREIYNVPPGDPDWTPKSGEHSLRFRYPAGEHWAEQRFEIGKTYPEIWMSFWLKVPTNYAHPQAGSAGDNQKLFRLWMDNYRQNDDGSIVGLSFRGDGEGGSFFITKIAGGGDKVRVPFINVPGDRGRWMHLVVHVAAETVPGESDGFMEVWRKWEGDSDYTKTHDYKNRSIRLSSNGKGFAAGYLMGYANGAYPVDTEFLIDDFALGTSPLFLN